MILDYSPIVDKDSAKMQVEGTIPSDGFEIAEDMLFASPIEVTGYIKNFGGEIELDLKLAADFEISCARCLKKFKKRLAVDMTEVINSEENKEYLIPENNKVSIDEAVRTTLLLNLSGKYLCREDCKGLCPVCGTDLNERSCGCDNQDIDPRLMVLKNLLK